MPIEIPNPNQLNDPAWAWAPYLPDTARPWTLQQAGHLYRRAAFGATWEQLQQALSDGPQVAVDKLLHPKADLAAFNQTYDEYEQAAASGAAVGAIAWWLRRMIETPHPLQEQMTLFWHNYFALTNARVSNSALMCRYLHLLRSHALGRFDTLLGAIAKEPALFMSLDARASRKARPSDHFPRILLEQFTVGPNHFSESDVQAVARAFTGWFVSQDQLRYIPREHDSGTKTLMGQSGDLDTKDVIRILLGQPATAQMVVRKLYRWLISETSDPPDTLIAPLAARFAQDFSISTVVEAMLRSNLFFSPVAYRQKIKSPVEFALGIIRPLGGTVPTLRLAADLADLGQDLYRPPTSKGWAGNQCWINPFTLVGRARLAQAFLAGSGPYEGKLDLAAASAGRSSDSLKDRTRFFSELWLQGDVADHTLQAIRGLPSASGETAQDSSSSNLRPLAYLIVASPEFQLA